MESHPDRRRAAVIAVAVQAGAIIDMDSMLACPGPAQAFPEQSTAARAATISRVTVTGTAIVVMLI